MLTGLRTKIRALSTDLLKSDIDPFTYSITNVFLLSESNVNDVTKATLNGVLLGSGDWSYNSDTQEVTVTASLSEGDTILVYYTYYKYSDTELDSFIIASLSWITVYNSECGDYELETTTIEPTPDNRTIDLIAICASILINPDWTEYKMPGVTIKYTSKKTKEDKIAEIVNTFKHSKGVISFLELE